MFFSVLLDVVVALYVLRRQRRIRPVPRALNLRLPVALGVIGLAEVLSYTDSHHVTGGDVAWVLGTLVVGAVLLGAVRALTVRVWTSNNWVVRQGTWLTMGLWVLSLGLHFVGGYGAQHVGAGNLEASSFLLYLGATYGVQNAVVHRRAVPLWDALGPEAGRRLQINFGQGPGGSGPFFATFRGGGSGFGPATPNTPRDDPTIIDAEVVDDDEGPAELR
ncbi:MAG: hypothetical protein ACLQRH_25530 [Acidimicrobiales bacterium]